MTSLFDPDCNGPLNYREVMWERLEKLEPGTPVYVGGIEYTFGWIDEEGLVCLFGQYKTDMHLTRCPEIVALDCVIDAAH